VDIRTCRRPAYGYVPRSARIQLHRLGTERGTEPLANVTAVWIARSPHNRRTYAVGWYRGAAINRESWHYRIMRPEQGLVEHQIEARADRARLRPPDQRVLPVPTAKVESNMGQNPVLQSSALQGA